MRGRFFYMNGVVIVALASSGAMANGLAEIMKLRNAGRISNDAAAEIALGISNTKSVSLMKHESAGKGAILAISDTLENRSASVFQSVIRSDRSVTNIDFNVRMDPGHTPEELRIHGARILDRNSLPNYAWVDSDIATRVESIYPTFDSKSKIVRNEQFAVKQYSSPYGKRDLTYDAVKLEEKVENQALKLTSVAKLSRDPNTLNLTITRRAGSYATDYTTVVKSSDVISDFTVSPDGRTLIVREARGVETHYSIDPVEPLGDGHNRQGSLKVTGVSVHQWNKANSVQARVHHLSAPREISAGSENTFQVYESTTR